MKQQECVQCGYCCTVAPCAYGKWSTIKHQCTYLTDDNKCAIYGRIKDDQWNPAMGAGCSSSLFNERRDKKIQEKIQETRK